MQFLSCISYLHDSTFCHCYYFIQFKRVHNSVFLTLKNVQRLSVVWSKKQNKKYKIFLLYMPSVGFFMTSYCLISLTTQKKNLLKQRKAYGHYFSLLLKHFVKSITQLYFLKNYRRNIERESANPFGSLLKNVTNKYIRLVKVYNIYLKYN